jgi:tyrosyl-tRNA synthetase
VHGDDAARTAAEASAVLFGAFDPRGADARTFEILAQEVPTATAPAADDGLALVDAVVSAGLAKSKAEARRAIEQGGIYVNQERERDAARRLGSADWIGGGHVLLRKGKKAYALLRRAG